MEKRIKVSVIIPTYNRLGVLKKCLTSLMRQTSRQFEVIIVDDGSQNREKLKKIVAKSSLKIKLRYQNHSGPATARNLAVKKAAGEVILFLNDDSLADKNLIERHQKFQSQNRDKGVALVGLTRNHPLTTRGGSMKWLVGQSGLHFNYHFQKTKEIEPIPWYYLWTCNCSVKKSFLWENKLEFDESFPTAAWEDIEFAYRSFRAGLKLYFDNRAVVWHYHQMSFDDLKARFWSHGRGLWHIRHKLPSNFLPFLVKNFWGRMILGLMAGWWWSAVERRVEEELVDKSVYPNWIMQWLVVRWKAEGYAAESKRMSGLSI